MGIRTVQRELEAKLVASSGGLFSKPTGKLERKWYADGEQRLKISIRNLKVPDGTCARVAAAGKHIAELELKSGTGRLDMRGSGDGELPDLEAGEAVVVEIDGEPVLTGTLRHD